MEHRQGREPVACELWVRPSKPLLRKSEKEMAFKFESAELVERPSASYRVITREAFGLGYSTGFDTVEAAAVFAKFEEEHGTTVLRIEGSDGTVIPVEMSSVAPSGTKSPS